MGKEYGSAETALNKFMDVIRDEIAENPSLRRRLTDALGCEVLYEGAEQFDGANPSRQAAKWSKEAFARLWNAATVGQIKKCFKENELATPSDLKGLRKAQLVDLLYERALEHAEASGKI